MGFNFPNGFPSSAEGWNKGGREERRLMWRKRRCVREKAGWWIWESRLSFCLGEKEGVCAPLLLSAQSLNHRGCWFLPAWGAFRYSPATAHDFLAIHLTIPRTSHSVRLGKYWAEAHAPDLRVLFWVSHQQRKLQGDALTGAWAVPATFHSSGLKSLLFFYKSLVQA